MPMPTLWAPWRVDYFDRAKDPAEQGCLFCRTSTLEPSEENLVLLKGVDAFALLNKYPYSNGHIMVAPRTHTANLTDLTGTVATEMWAMAAKCQMALEQTMGCQGLNLGMNLGKAAGAGIPDHLHLHLVPRWVGDVNFMTTIADTRVMPEALAGTWRTLHKALQS